MMQVSLSTGNRIFEEYAYYLFDKTKNQNFNELNDSNEPILFTWQKLRG
jgi:hypothetical protein